MKNNKNIKNIFSILFILFPAICFSQTIHKIMQIGDSLEALDGEIQSNINLSNDDFKNRCKYVNDRCKYVKDICKINSPPLKEIENQKFTAYFLYHDSG